MEEITKEENLKSEVAQQKPRDAEGHFIHQDHSLHPSQPQPAQPGLTQQLVSSLFPTKVNVEHSAKNDDLLDVHLGNPLRKIQQLLEDIKQQKAFSFTLKGSLGIMGVVLAFSVFGFFGTSKMLCSKGTQSHIGIVRQLSFKEDPNYIPVITELTNTYDYIINKKIPTPTTNRIVLLKPDNTTIQLAGFNSQHAKFLGNPVIATGSYDDCSRTLKLQDNSLETY